MYKILVNTFQKTIDYKINEIEELNAPPEGFYFVNISQKSMN